MSKFVIRPVPTGLKFDLKASNGQAVLTSEVYTTEEACLKGILSIRKNAPTANIENQTECLDCCSNPKFEMYTDKAGFFRFRLKARNGKVIAVSNTYTSKSSCAAGMEFVRKNAQNAEISHNL